MARRADRDVFVDTLRGAGGRVSNPTLRRLLDWDEGKYLKVHTQLFEAGTIEKSRGYGGAVILVQSPSETPVSEEDSIKLRVTVVVSREETIAVIASPQRELDLYEPVRQQLERHWAESRKLDDCYCEITALQGRRETGGSWSRPDLALIAYKKYEFMPAKLF